MVLNETFGQAGTAVEFFGGSSQWWLVGLLLLIVFLLFLMAYRVNVNGIITLLLTGLLSIGYYQLFIINEQYVQTILFFIFMFVGFIAYLWFSR